MMRGGTVAGASDLASGGSWRQALAAAVRDPARLLAAVDLPAELLPAARRAAASFPLLVPWSYVARMRRGDPADPLLRQVLPLDAELAPQPSGYGTDPLQEEDCQPVPGLLHKYADRVLLVGTGACAVHCRYCFRRHFPYQATQRRGPWWAPAVEYVRARQQVHEVIVSGGDPWTLSDAVLAAQARAFAGIGHVQRLRWHTRLPVVLPARVDAALCTWLAQLPVTRCVVLHANHANELDDAVAAACARLGAAGCRLLNQAVLLRGVNDSVAAQAALAERAVAIGVQPYYLHQLDPVAGAAHFAVPDAQAVALMQALHARLGGWLLPRLVREEPGRPGKTPIPW